MTNRITPVSSVFLGTLDWILYTLLGVLTYSLQRHFDWVDWFSEVANMGPWIRSLEGSLTSWSVPEILWLDEADDDKDPGGDSCRYSHDVKTGLNKANNVVVALVKQTMPGDLWFGQRFTRLRPIWLQKLRKVQQTWVPSASVYKGGKVRSFTRMVGIWRWLKVDAILQELECSKRAGTCKQKLQMYKYTYINCIGW